ncbi:putative membrane protein [Acinetobacter sp. 1294596]|nr:putative membrane protein [Acinetobacter sp. 1294596]
MLTAFKPLYFKSVYGLIFSAFLLSHFVSSAFTVAMTSQLETI